MKIIIRADGGAGIGMGHLMRTSVLADELKSFAAVQYACIDIKEHRVGIDFLQNKGYEVIRLNENSPLEDLLKTNADCLITDSYKVDTEYFKKMSRYFPITGYIDDLNMHVFSVDFLINQNPYGPDLEYRVKEGTKLFLGLEYALLRKEFHDIPQKNIKKEVQDIMITMGGADPQDYSTKLALKIKQVFPDITLHIIVGSSFENINVLKKIADKNIKLYFNAMMSEVMQQCDIAISACGSTLYELSACGVPTIGIVIAENQNMAASKMEALGAIKKGEVASVARQIGVLDYEQRSKMSKIQRKIVDGRGSKKLSQEIISIVQNK